MVDLHAIRRVVARTRRRLRFQAALEGATTAGILAVAAALIVLWLWRMELLSSAAAAGLFVAAGGLVVAGALMVALRRQPEARVAARLDRASGLADRLGTALDFERRVDAESHPEIQAFMRAAIDDAIACAPRADVRAASRFRAPRDLRALGAFAVVGAAVAALAFHPTPPPIPLALRGPDAKPPIAASEGETMDPDDLDYQRQFVEEMKVLAAQTDDQSLKEMTQELQKLLEEAAKGSISKQSLLEKMDALERKYAQGGSNELDKLLGGLKDQGKELKKQKVTQRLGEALEKGDLEAAQKELERLADEMDKGEMKPEEQKQLTDALDKAAAKTEESQKRQEEKTEKETKKKIEDKDGEVRRLEKQVAQNPNDEEKQRTLAKDKRELEELKREPQGSKPGKNSLQRLTRSLQNSAQSLKQKDGKQAEKELREGAQELKRQSQNQKQAQNQKRVQSQLRDLKDAISRAKPHRGNGKSQMEAMRQERIQEWEQRAGGLRGNPGAWRKTSSDGQQGPGGQRGQNGQNGPGDKGQNPDNSWGTEHDPNLTDDPTRMANAKFSDDQLKGREGQGASRRETILTSAQKGFAQTSYRQIYTDYKKVVEEVMSQEKVPQGYKYYVKRYFQRIKPHSMDE